MKGYCPIHEYDWDLCSTGCADSRRLFQTASHLLMDYWRAREIGIRKGYRHPNPGRKFHIRLQLVQRVKDDPMCSGCGQRPPVNRKRFCTKCRYQRSLVLWAQRT